MGDTQKKGFATKNESKFVPSERKEQVSEADKNKAFKVKEEVEARVGGSEMSHQQKGTQSEYFDKNRDKNQAIHDNISTSKSQAKSGFSLDNPTDQNMNIERKMGLPEQRIPKQQHDKQQSSGTQQKQAKQEVETDSQTKDDSQKQGNQQKIGFSKDVII